MDKFVIRGGIPLHGEVTISGAKNVALKMLIASLLTDEEIVIHNVPLLRDVATLLDVLTDLGLHAVRDNYTIRIKDGTVKNTKVSLDVGARVRTSSLVLGPLLARYGKAIIPNPGGCRLGARPIDRQIEGLRLMGATIEYNSDDGYFYAQAKKLHGAVIKFPKNTHTGTEALILGAVLADGTTVLQNAAEEVEIDDLITCLNAMGAKIQRTKPREIVIEGVNKLHGTEYTIMPDRNEEVTFAIAALITQGNILVRNSQPQYLGAFFDALAHIGGVVESVDEKTTRYSRGDRLGASTIATGPYPYFMTDWQAPWAVLMTQTQGESSIHETVFESRFSYVKELKKMGAKIEFYDPPVERPEEFYNFNWTDRKEGYHQGIKIHGPTPLHNAVLQVNDIRAGATLVLAALVASGESYVHGLELIDRGYEKIEERLQGLGAHIHRVVEEDV